VGFPDVILSVFWCGTGGTIRGMTTQVGLFASQCLSPDVETLKPLPARGEMKMCFDGCGITNGTSGTLWALGLDTQAEQVYQVVSQLLALGSSIRINCLGLSRGGMACLLLAKLLATKHVDINRVELNLFLFDPVPGNGLTSVAVDVMRWSMASMCMDLRGCVHLNDVVAIYPHQPLPAVAFHAPILPQYPIDAKVEEDVWLGCHQGALQPGCHFLDSQMSYFRIREFLENHGTRLSPSMNPSLTADFLLNAMNVVIQSELSPESATSRDTHSFSCTVIRRKAAGRYLNKFHKRLAGAPSEAKSTQEQNTEFVLVIDRK